MKTAIKKILYPLIKSRPDFLIIGAQKAGTTSLYHYLEQHPRLMSNKSWKEVHFFDIDENYAKGLYHYLAHFHNRFVTGSRLTFEATPEYLAYDYTAERIVKTLGKVKCIAILREPAARAYSAWRMFHSVEDAKSERLRRNYDARSFADAIHQELQEEPTDPNYRVRYLMRGRYAEQVQRYFDIMGRDRVLILDFAALKTDMQGLLDEVYDFLGVRHFTAAEVEGMKGEVRNQGKSGHKEDIEDVMQELRAYFAPHNEALFELIGRRFDW